MWNYYRDVTLYAIAICLLFGMVNAPARETIKSGVMITLLVFGVFGTGLGVLAFGYFQKQQYYMYFNLGFTKRKLVLTTWVVNFAIGIFLSICFSLAL